MSDPTRVLAGTDSGFPLSSGRGLDERSMKKRITLPPAVALAERASGIATNQQFTEGDPFMTSRIALASLALALVAGCASTKVTQETPIRSEKLAKPAQIIVYDFGATATDVPADAAIHGYAEHGVQTSEDVATGRKLGALVAKELVQEIVEMGLPAKLAAAGGTPGAGDLVIRGYFLSVDEGSRAKRLVIGFGAGGAELQTVVEGYQMTAQGLRKLGSGTIDASGGKAPGAAVPAAVLVATGNPIGLAVSTAVKAQGEISGRTTIEGRAKSTAAEIAKELEVRFRKQGWIS